MDPINIKWGFLFKKCILVETLIFTPPTLSLSYTPLSYLPSEIPDISRSGS
jgi:hypothetical protein